MSISYLRVSITESCNLKCFYCRPDSSPFKMKEEYLTYDEIGKLVKGMAKYGLKKVRITGGEPLIRPKVSKLVKILKGIDGIEDVSITTNGLTLYKQLKDLKEAGLDRLNISLDTLNSKKFKIITGGNIENVIKSIEEASKIGFKSIKINVVALRDRNNPMFSNEEEILEFIEFAKEYNLEVRFIEMMPIGFNFGIQREILKMEDIKKIIEDRYGRLIPTLSYGSGAAKVYKIENLNLKVGFISPISQPFCDNCSKLRLTADGNIKLCLRTDEEIPAREVIRYGSEADIDRFIKKVIIEKELSNQKIISSGYKFSECSRDMIGIGG